MILEGIVTTADELGVINVAPMGPEVDPQPTSWKTFILKPFKSSTTYRNLKKTACGVLHVTDDVLLFAHATIGKVNVPTVAAETVHCRRLADCCRYYEFTIESWDESSDRTQLLARVTHSGTVREFFGFNRAMFAVIEAAIVASRLHLLSLEQVEQQMSQLAKLVEKTAGAREHEAFTLLRNYCFNQQPSAGQ